MKSRLPLMVLVLAIAWAQPGCGGPDLPVRGVIEENVDQWNFRRYQAVLDIEVWVPKNSASAYTASYVRRSAEKRGRLEDGDVINAFVTRYKKSKGVQRAFVKFARRLAQESGYLVEDEKLGGARLFVIKGHGETWAMWAGKKHIVKVGGRAVEKVPEELVEAYADRYPSKVKEGALEGELPGDVSEDKEPEVEKTPEYDPDNPTPDWQRGKKKKKKRRRK